MTLDQLRYFLEAANFQHVGRAGRSIHISPSAISNAIAILEKELSCRLFDRKAQRIILTAQGEKLKKRARTLLDEVSSLGEEMRNRRQGLQGNFRLAASHFLYARLLGPAWFSLQDQHSRLTGELFSMDTASLLAEILSGRLDMGLCFSPLRHPDLHEVKLYDGELLIAVGKRHPLLRRPPHDRLKEISNFPATIHKAARGVDICETHPMYDKFGIRPKIDLFFDSDEAAVRRLEVSHSWSLLPDIVIHSVKPGLRILAAPLGWSAPYCISMVLHKEHARDDAFIRLTAELKAKVKKDPLFHP